MTFRIKVAPLVRFKVEGIFTGEDGETAPFDFLLTCDRLADQADVDGFNRAVGDRLTELNKGAGGIEQPNAVWIAAADVLAPRVRGFSGIVDDAGAEVPFSAEAVRQILACNGIAQLASVALVRESGAKAKNS